MTVINQQELEQRLGLGRVDVDELTFILSDHLSGGEFISESRMDYPSTDDPVLSLLYNDKGELCGIKPGEGLTDELVTQITQDVANKLLAPPKIMVHRIVLADSSSQSIT